MRLNANHDRDTYSTFIRGSESATELKVNGIKTTCELQWALLRSQETTECELGRIHHVRFVG